MTTCIRCGDYSSKVYCPHCTDKVYELKASWDETIHKLTDEVCNRARSMFQDLEERPTAPCALEVLAEALHAIELADYGCYNRQLAQIWEELNKADPREFPSEEEMLEAKGDADYHAMKEEGLRGR
jgi:hypothetical protein